MTRERIAKGLELLTLQLANGETHCPSRQDLDAGEEDWTPQEWAYLKGIACAAIWNVRARLVTVGS